MKILITGGCGFLGSNLAQDAILKGDDVLVFDNLSRQGSRNNLEWLQSQGKFAFVHGDIRSRNDVSLILEKFEPDVVFHLAGQVAMTTSIANPQMDFEINVMGTYNLLESIRCHGKNPIVIYSSTNKVYGDLEQFDYEETETRYSCVQNRKGFDENTQLSFHSPYGCSKGAADQYMLDYARIFGMRTVVFRHSSMYGGRQFSTYDQGWVGWFCQKAVEAMKGHGSSFSISGNGKQVRDVLHADDMKKLYRSAISNIQQASGQAFNVGGGYENSLSLLELFDLLESITKTKLKYNILPVRESDQKVFVADLRKSNKLLNWHPGVGAFDGISQMVDWTQSLFSREPHSGPSTQKI